MKIVVIGAGIAGLSTAVRLAVDSHDVTVFEANDYPGGKLHSFKLGSYRFDGGPSLFTMPHYVTELFELAGKNPEDYFTFERADEACRYFWEDGKRLAALSDPKAFAEEAERVFRFPASELISYFDHIKNIYDHSGKIFLEKPLNRASTWLSKETAAAFIRIFNYDLQRTMHEANRIRIGEPHLVQLFDRFATYNGSDPYRAPGILNVIPWLEHGFGTFFPHGGMANIPKSIHRLAEDLGVEFRFGQKVDKIVHDKGKARGVQVSEKKVEADIVVSNMDVHFTYQKLLTDVRPPQRILKQERSSSAIVFYWGMNRSFEELGLHNIFFSDQYKKEFEQLFNGLEPLNDSTIYIHISSKLQKSDAPEGGENWFVMVNAPHHQGQDWKNIEKKVRTAVIKKLSRLLNCSIDKHIVEERTWNPKGIESDTWSYKGALYGNSSNSKLAAFLRHPNQHAKIRNLYFAGGSVHPGGGIPLALLSGRITHELIANK